MTAGGWVAVAFLAEFAAAAVVFRGLRRRASPPHGAGAVTAPVPGSPIPPRGVHHHSPAAQPRAAVPGTGPHPEHGTRLLSADFYEDGTVLVHDHLHQRTTKFEAPVDPGPGLDWDGWLQGLTP